MPLSKITPMQICLGALLGWFSAGTACGDFIVNAAKPINRRLDVQIIQAAKSDGSNPAPLFGSASAQETIFAGIDTIWAQAGIDVQFKFRLSPYLDSFTLTGTAGMSNPRPASDINTIFSGAQNAGGVLDSNAKVVNLFMVRIVPGFSQESDNVSNGLSYVNGNGITLWIGPNLTTFTEGLEVISQVLAHEIGHNLGLAHFSGGQNLMQGASVFEESRLTADQIGTARSSSLLIVIPEPQGLVLVFASIPTFLFCRRQVRQR